MNGNDGDPVVFACRGDACFVKPFVPCTAKLCERIKQYVDSIEAGRVADLSFDLSETPYIDSTFVGFLVSLATSKSETAPSLHLVCPTDSVSTALSAMHVLELFDIRDSLERAPLEWKALPDTAVDGQNLAKLVVEAHEKLIDADDRNAAAFRPVVDGMKADLRKRRPTA